MIMKTNITLMLLAVIIASVMSRRLLPIRSDKEADPANAAYMYLTDHVCGNCFQDCYEPEDGIQQINTCADECKCRRKRTMERLTSDEAIRPII